MFLVPQDCRVKEESWLLVLFAEMPSRPEGRDLCIVKSKDGREFLSAIY